MIDVFLTSIYPEKIRDILLPSVVNYSRWPVRVIATTPIENPPELKRVKWIHTTADVMIAQEMALNACTAPYVIHAVDDLRFDPGTIDALVEAIESGPKLIASPCYYHHNAPEMGAHHPGIFIGVPGNPLVQPMNALYKREDLVPFLPYDRQFEADYGFTDITMKMMEAGWRTKLIANRVYDVGNDPNSLWCRRGVADWERLKRKWAPNGVINPKVCQ